MISTHSDGTIGSVGEFAPPFGWVVKRVGDLATLVNGFPFPSGGFSKVGGERLIRIRDLQGDDDPVFFTGPPQESARLRGGDIVIGMDGDFDAVLWFRGSALLNQRLCLLRPVEGRVDRRFLHYSLPGPLKVINDLTYFTTVKHLSSGQVRAIRLPCPDIKLQERIADFLDRKTAAIDALVEKKERMLALLAEQRAAVINQAVTKGLDPTVQMKDSGVARLGEVPANWGVTRLKFVARLAYGESLPDDQRRPGDTVVYGSNGAVGAHDRANMLVPAIVVGRKGSFGKVTYAPHGGFAIDTTYYVDERSTSADLRWLYYLLTTLDLDGHSQDTGVPGLSRDAAHETSLAIPHITVQRAVAIFLDSKVATFDSLINELGLSIARILEYRQALITSAVTGQIAVAEHPAL